VQPDFAPEKKDGRKRGRFVGPEVTRSARGTHTKNNDRDELRHCVSSAKERLLARQGGGITGCNFRRPEGIS